MKSLLFVVLMSFNFVAHAGTQQIIGTCEYSPASKFYGHELSLIIIQTFSSRAGTNDQFSYELVVRQFDGNTRTFVNVNAWGLERSSSKTAFASDDRKVKLNFTIDGNGPQATANYLNLEDADETGGVRDPKMSCTISPNFF